MGMDSDISNWILEFLVRNLMDDHLLEQVISILPLPDKKDSLRWNKTMLLKTMQSEILEGSVSEKLLDLLERIAEVDRREGFVVFDTMKSAYCAVAVDCTVRFMEEDGNSVDKYVEAVERIWRARIGNLEKSESVDLISDELKSWRDDIEAALWNDEACKKIITRSSRSEAALKTVGAYVTEAWKVMGPTFLEVVAKKMGKSLMESQKLSILPNASLGVCKSNVRDEDLAGERVVNPPDVFQNLGGVSDECAVEDETQAGDRGRTSSGVVDGSTIPAAINENQDERIASPRPNVGGDMGVIDEFANDQFENRASSVHQDLGGSAKPANIDELHVQQIAIPLALIEQYFADVQAKRSNQERASTSLDASRDSAGDRDGVTIFPRHLGGSTEPAITSGNQVEDMVISLPNVGVELNVSDELTKRDKDQVKESAATLCSASEDWGVRDGSLMKHKDQRGEEAANICQDSGGSSNSAMPVNNQAEQMERLAEAVISDMGSKQMNNEPSVETLDRMDVDVASHSVDESVEAVQVDENNVSDLFSEPQNDAPRPSLIEETHNSMDANAPNSFSTKSSGAVQGNEDNEPRPSLLARNGTARTYEWDELIDGSSEGPSTSKRLHLRRTKRKVVSPLKKYEPAKFATRRKNKKWSDVEEDTLRTGVQRYGKGNWKVILNSFPDIFEDRIEGDLKDKWRNMMK